MKVAICDVWIVLDEIEVNCDREQQIRFLVSKLWINTLCECHFILQIRRFCPHYPAKESLKNQYSQLMNCWESCTCRLTKKNFKKMFVESVILMIQQQCCNQKAYLLFSIAINFDFIQNYPDVAYCRFHFNMSVNAC